MSKENRYLTFGRTPEQLTGLDLGSSLSPTANRKPASMPTIVRFDCYEVDLEAGQLLKRGTKIRLREQCVQVLAALLERPGQVVTREDLRHRLWPDEVFVDFDNNLNSVVARLRDVLNDSAERPRFIETLPRHGYRFVGIVSSPALVAASAGTRLLVLPFVNSSGDPAQEHFSDAVTDGLITELAALAPAHLAVIARTTAMRYKGSGKDVAQIGRELNVEYIVEGGVRRVDDRLQVNAQLIRKSDQAHVFARRYDAPIPDLLETERAVARAVAEQLHVLPVAGVEHGPALGLVASDDNQDCRLLSRGGPEDVAAPARPTPTPEAVAVSDETFGISVGGAVLFLIAAVVLLVPVLALSGRVTDLGKTRPELSSTALAARARDRGEGGLASAAEGRDLRVPPRRGLPRLSRRAQVRLEAARSTSACTHPILVSAGPAVDRAVRHQIGRPGPRVADRARCDESPAGRAGRPSPVPHDAARG